MPMFIDLVLINTIQVQIMKHKQKGFKERSRDSKNIPPKISKLNVGIIFPNLSNKGAKVSGLNNTVDLKIGLKSQLSALVGRQRYSLALENKIWVEEFKNEYFLKLHSIHAILHTLYNHTYLYYKVACNSQVCY